MSGQAYDSYTFVVLFRGDRGLRIQQMLRAAVNPESPRAVYVQLPEVRGLDFLTARGPLGAGLDSWWQRNVLPSSLPVYLIRDEPDLPAWIRGTDGCWFIAVDGPERERVFVALAEPAFPVVARDLEVVAEQAMLALGGRGEINPVFHPTFPYGQEPISWARAVPRLNPRLPELVRLRNDAVEVPAFDPAPRRSLPAALREAGTAEYRAHVPLRPSQPISYDVEPVPGVELAPGAERAAAPMPRDVPGGKLREALRKMEAGPQLLGRIFRATSGRAVNPSPAMGPTVNANRPMMVGFASRKGGVGKTTHAAATAATIGESLDGLADTAALVDGNITNPDSWALNPPRDSATVRTLVSRLTQGQDPPPEQYARTPRLAIYPEDRDSEEAYTQTEIDVVAEYLRRRHSFIAVDLPNALPSLTSGGPGAVSAAWLIHCDLVVLPFNADPRARQGLLEYVAALADDPALARLPIVAPYIVSRNRAIAADPAVLGDIADLRRRGVEIVEVPDDENALLALLRDLPINQASPALRQSYVNLTETVVATVLRARRKQ